MKLSKPQKGETAPAPTTTATAAAMPSRSAHVKRYARNNTDYSFACVLLWAIGRDAFGQGVRYDHMNGQKQRRR